MKKWSLWLVVPILFLHFMAREVLATDWNIEVNLSGELTYSEQLDVNIGWQAEIRAIWLHFQSMVGKEQIVWGVGKTDTLGLSRTSPIVPVMGYEIDVLQSNYTHLLIPLERETNRWLFAHRLETNLIPNLKVGVWEMLMSSDQVFYGYFIPVPLIPLYAIQHVAYKTSGVQYDIHSNVMFGLDAAYDLNEDWQLYGELVVDDFPQKSTYKNPRKIGGLMGLSWLGQREQGRVVWAEYVRLNNYIYTHKSPNSRYLYHDQPFGHWLGMDGDLLAVGVEQQLGNRDQFTGHFRIIRKGEGYYDDNWQPEYGNNLEFLTGVVEHRAQLYLQWNHSVTPTSTVETFAVLGNSWNSNHIAGKEQMELQFGIKLNSKIGIL